MTLSTAAVVEAFVPLFVAMNTFGVLPLFIGLTEGMDTPTRRGLVRKAILTAFIIAAVVVGAGRFIFETLGITVNDLRIGGGIILLVLSITDLLFSNLTRRTQNQSSTGAVESTDDIGVVPLGTPLTVGPAAITTLLVLQEGFGYAPTLIALVANLVISFTVFYFGPALLSVIGASASRAVGKVASLFLAAISVAMIRTGIVETVSALA